MKARVSLITLAVADLQRSVRFYEGVLKLPRIPMPPEANIAFFDLGTTWLSLYPRAEFAKEVDVPEPEIANGGRCGVTLAHNLSSIEAVDTLFDELRAANVPITKGPHKTFWGGYSGYFADPDDFPWEVAWNPDFPHPN